VLPILHLNGFKIANPTVLARISRQELTDLLHGFVYDPHFVEGDEPAAVHELLATALDHVLAEIRRIQSAARSASEAENPERPRWPMIVFQTPKGWTGPKFVDGKRVEGTWRAHQVPIADFKNPEHLKQLEEWMRSSQRWRRQADAAWALTCTPTEGSFWSRCRCRISGITPSKSPVRGRQGRRHARSRQVFA
jgi:xylulose-5-phosphate/fructose-6-phosphate phosphoketolase